MVRNLYIPEVVKREIKNHIQRSIYKSIDGYQSASDEEDTFTGQLFGNLRIKKQIIYPVESDFGNLWIWSIEYNKFRSKGRNAPEKIIGADGIFEIKLERRGKIDQKSLLFQSKNDWIHKDKKLYVQSTKLLTWREAAVIINYTPNRIETFDINDVIRMQGAKPDNYLLLGNLLGEEFLNCNIGDSDLKYDALRHELKWYDVNDKYVFTKFKVNDRLRINIESKNVDDKIQYREIPNSLISEHRMKSNIEKEKIKNAEDIYTLKKIKKEINKKYHPDRYLLPEVKDLYNDILQELNNNIEQRQKILLKQKSE